jgi:signal transduction histidine kinase
VYRDSRTEGEMTLITLPDVEKDVARCRLILSGCALVALTIDATHRVFPWSIAPAVASAVAASALAVLSVHLVYSSVLYLALAKRMISPQRARTLTPGADVLFSATLLLLPVPTIGLFYLFFAFAVASVGLRSGFRAAVWVTAIPSALSLSPLVFSVPTNLPLTSVRALDLAILGGLIAYLGQLPHRLATWAGRRAAATERRRFAHTLHDGCVQTLAGLNLQLQSCRELLRRGHSEEVRDLLGEILSSVDREHDALRAYARSLVDLTVTHGPPRDGTETRFTVRADFSGSSTLVDQVLQIMREGVANTRRHAQARSAALCVHARGSEVDIIIDDDGIGFRDAAQQPWSIASRVAELEGCVRVTRDRKPGAHLAIVLPAT